MVDTVTAGNLFEEILGQVPEFRVRVAAEREWNVSIGQDPDDLDHFAFNPYTLAYELFDTVIVPALNAEEPQDDLLTRCFALLERAAVSPDSAVRENLSLAVTDVLTGALGPTAYAHAGSAFRELMRTSGVGAG